MTLLDQVAADLNCDESRARQALGPLFMLLKLATPRDTFAQIQAVVPDAVSWAHASAQGSTGRTGELLTLITPDNIRTRILADGFSEDHVDQIGQTVGRFLRRRVGAGLADRIAEIVPLIRPAVNQG